MDLIRYKHWIVVRLLLSGLTSSDSGSKLTIFNDRLFPAGALWTLIPILHYSFLRLSTREGKNCIFQQWFGIQGKWEIYLWIVLWFLFLFQLALYNSQVRGSSAGKTPSIPSPTSAPSEECTSSPSSPTQPTTGEINPRQSTASSGSINSALSAEEKQQSSGAPSTSSSTGECRL